jgi:hypothetical protein
MPSNSFVPDTVPVKSHSRRMPAKRDSTRQSSFSPTENAMGAPSPPDQPAEPSSFAEAGPGTATTPQQDFSQPEAYPEQAQTAFGNPIRARQDLTRTAAGLAGILASMVAPEVKVAGPLAGVVSKAPGFIQPVLNAVPSALSRAVFAGGGAAVVDPHEAIPNAVASLAGEPLAGIVGGAGRGTMSVALKSAPREAATAIREGIPATSGGVRRLFAKIGQTGKDIQAAVLRASRGGRFRLNTGGVADEIEKRVEADLAKSSTVSDAARAQLADLKTRFQRTSPNILHLDQAHIFKQSASDAAKPQFIRLENGQKIQMPSDPIEQLWKLHESEVLNESLRRIVPEYEKLNARQSELIRLKNVLAPDVNDQMGLGAKLVQAATSPAARTIGGATAGAMLPAHDPGSRLQHAAAGAALSNPAVLSYLALMMGNPGLLKLIGRSGQAVYGSGALSQ